MVLLSAVCAISLPVRELVVSRFASVMIAYIDLIF